MNTVQAFPRQSWWHTSWELVELAKNECRRRAVPAVIASLVVGAAVIGLFPHDHALEAWVMAHRTPETQAAAATISHWGKLQCAPLAVLALVWLWGRRFGLVHLRLAAAAALLAAVSSGLAADLLKFLLGRPRPYTAAADGLYWFQLSAGFQSLPSGHATHCAAIIGALLPLAPRVATGLAPLALLVMAARIWAAAHFPSDVLAGAWFGLMTGMAFGLAARAWLARHAMR